MANHHPKYTTHPRSLTVIEVSEMPVTFDTGETETTTNVKLTQEQAKLLHEIIGKQLHKKAGFVSFSLRAKIK